NDPDEWFRLALFLRQLRELTKRFLEVAIDVVRESLEGRNVQAIDPILEFAPELFRVQLVDDVQERGERLAAPRRRGDEDALPRVDEWHGVGLRFRETLELRPEPVSDQGFHEAEDFVFRSGRANPM